MSLALAILGFLTAGIYFYLKIDVKFKKSPAEKVKEIIAETEAALEKANKTSDTKDLEDLINK